MSLITTMSGQPDRVKPLADVIAELPQLPDDFDFGKDMRLAHETLFSDEASEEEKRAALFAWTGRRQPCSVTWYITPTARRPPSRSGTAKGWTTGSPAARRA